MSIFHGVVANSGYRQNDARVACNRLSGEPLELLSEGRLRLAGILCPSFAHHVNHLDAAQHDASAVD